VISNVISAHGMPGLDVFPSGCRWLVTGRVLPSSGVSIYRMQLPNARAQRRQEIYQRGHKSLIILEKHYHFQVLESFSKSNGRDVLKVLELFFAKSS